MSELQYVRYLSSFLRARLDATRRDERGYSTEAIIITALLALLAIGAVAVIAAKVMAKANDLQTG